MGPSQGRRVFTRQTLPAGDPDPVADKLAKVAGFSPIGSRRGPQAMDGLSADSLHAGVAAKAHERKQRE